MKKILPLVILSVFVTWMTQAQDKTEEIERLTSGKWHVYEMQVGNEKLEFAENENWMLFNTDGVYQVVLNSQEKKGTWKFVEDKKEITFDESEIEKNFKIMKITNKELLVAATEGDMVYTMVLKR